MLGDKQGRTQRRDDDEKIDNLKDIQAELAAQKKVKIMIPSTETQRDDVAVGVCGHTYLIKRDEVVDVPESVVEVLRNAVMTLYRQVKREDGEGNELRPYNAQRFAFQILG